jgi:hypothetical protein
MPSKPVPEADDDVPELLTWEAEIDGDEEEEDFEEELPADELMFAEGEGSEEEGSEADDFSGERPAELPQPDRARSHPDLPRVKSTTFKRIIR